MPQSLQINRFGGPEVFQLVEKPAASLNPTDIRIQVKASGVNFADIMMRQGIYPEAPKPPFVPGYELAGEVLEVGSAVHTYKPGDRVVAGSKFGGYTTEIVLPATHVRAIPQKLSFAEAASIPVNFMTAWVALHDMARVRKGDRVLIQSAAGGVGVAATQIASQVGAYVVGLVGSTGKADVVKSLGAHEVWTNETWENESDEKLGHFDIILDSAGGKSLKQSFRRLSPAGRVISFGLANAVGRSRSFIKIINTLLNTPLYTPFKLMMQNKGVYGLNMLAFFEQASVMTSALDQILRDFSDGKLKAVVGKTFPLADGGQAHTYLQSRQNIGKVVLVS